MQPRSVELVIPQKTLPLPGRDVTRREEAYYNNVAPAQRSSEIVRFNELQGIRATTNNTARAELRLLVEFNTNQLAEVQASIVPPATSKTSGLRQNLSPDMLRALLSDKDSETPPGASADIQSAANISRYRSAEQNFPTTSDSLFSFAV
jgi:hypothetical protein